MEVSGQLHATADLPPGKSPWYPLDRRLGGPQSRSGRGGEEKIPSPCRDSNHPIIQSSFKYSHKIFHFSIPKNITLVIEVVPQPVI
jgi:hypothetical protein